MCGGWDEENQRQQQQERRHRRVDHRRPRAGGGGQHAAGARRRRAGAATGQDYDNTTATAALDMPPPVASPTGPSPTTRTLSSSAVWQLRELRHQTPQHLATLTLDGDEEHDDGFAPVAAQHPTTSRQEPLHEQDDDAPTNHRQPRIESLTVSSMRIVGERYLAVGTDQGTVAVWDLVKVLQDEKVDAEQDLTPSSVPSASDDTGEYGAVAATSSSLPASPSPSIPRFVDLRRHGMDAVAGRVVGMCSYRDATFVSESDAEAMKVTDTLVVAATEWGVVCVVDVAEWEVVCRFETGRCSVTCVEAIPNAISFPSVPPTLLVGYQTGDFECWTIRPLGASSSADTGTSPPKPPSKLRFKAHLLARGSNDSGYPIRSIASFPVRPNSVVKDDGDTKEGDNVQSTPPSSYAVVTLESNRPTPASRTVSVVDLSSLMAAYSSRNNDPNETSDERTNNSVILLEDHCVHPVAEREWVDWSLPFAARPPLPAQWIPSVGTNQATSLPGVGVAVCTADGSVAILREFPDPGERESFAWGIIDPSDQLLLSYPAIGIGSVSLRQEGRAASQHLVCCLRGGTVYFVPLEPPDVGTSLGRDQTTPLEPSLKVVTYPSDLDTDVVAVLQVQCFAAGNVRHNSSLASSQPIPILVYAWPGGIIDIYACQLQTRTWSRPAGPLLQQLVENGSVRLLQQLLLSGNATASMQGPLWAEAKEELVKRRDAKVHEEDSNPIPSPTVGELEGNELQAFRQLLLQLATSVITHS